MDNKYEKQIGLKTIYLTFVRRWMYMLIIFVPVVAAAYIYTQKIMKDTYSSIAVISKNAVFDQTRYNDMKSNINSSYESTVTALGEAGVKHSNGNPITINDLAAVSVDSFVANKYTVTLSMSSSESGITQPILTELAKQAVEKCYNHDAEGNRTTAKSNFEGTQLNGGKASAATPSGKAKKYFIIGAAAGAVLALGLPFIYEITSDEVYEASDLTSYGIPAFDIKATTKASKKKKLMLEI